MDAILERFNLDPLAGYDDFVFENAEVIQYITEASEGATKKNILQKLWDLIKKLINILKKGLAKMINFIKRLVSRKNKTADQIIQEALGESLKPNKVSGDSLNVKMNAIQKDGSIKVEEFDVAAKNIYAKLKDDCLYINWNMWKGGLDADNKVSDGKSMNQPKGGMFFQYHIFFNFYENLEKIDQKFHELETKLQNGQMKDGLFDYMGLEALILPKVQHAFKFKEKELKLDRIDQILDLIKWAEEHLLTDKNKWIRDEDEPHSIKFFNCLAQVLSGLQFAINDIGTCLRLRDDIDASFVKSVHSAEDLDKVVKAFIDNHLPAGVIARMTARIADENLCFYTLADNVPIGQSRGVLIPKDKKIVYKFATNQIGIMGNKNENTVTNIARKTDTSDLIAQVIKLEKNACVSMIEKASTPAAAWVSPNYAEQMKNLNKELNSRTGKFAKSGYHVIDLHMNNVGLIGDRLVATDYGMIEKL